MWDNYSTEILKKLLTCRTPDERMGHYPSLHWNMGKNLTWLTSIQIWRVKRILFSLGLTICSFLAAFLIFKIGYSLSPQHWYLQYAPNTPVARLSLDNPPPTLPTSLFCWRDGGRRRKHQCAGGECASIRRRAGSMPHWQ